VDAETFGGSGIARRAHGGRGRRGGRGRVRAGAARRAPACPSPACRRRRRARAARSCQAHASPGCVCLAGKAHARRGANSCVCHAGVGPKPRVACALAGLCKFVWRLPGQHWLCCAHETAHWLRRIAARGSCLWCRACDGPLSVPEQADAAALTGRRTPRRATAAAGQSTPTACRPAESAVGCCGARRSARGGGAAAAACAFGGWGSYEAESLSWEPCPGAHRKGHAGACRAVVLAPAALRQQHGELVRHACQAFCLARGALAGVGGWGWTTSAVTERARRSERRGQDRGRRHAAGARLLEPSAGCGTAWQQHACVALALLCRARPLALLGQARPWGRQQGGRPFGLERAARLGACEGRRAVMGRAPVAELESGCPTRVSAGSQACRACCGPTRGATQPMGTG